MDEFCAASDRLEAWGKGDWSVVCGDETLELPEHVRDRVQQVVQKWLRHRYILAWQGAVHGAKEPEDEH